MVHREIPASEILDTPLNNRVNDMLVALAIPRPPRDDRTHHIETLESYSNAFVDGGYGDVDEFSVDHPDGRALEALREAVIYLLRQLKV